MSYSAEISRENPSCFLFLIDQSGSMADKVSGLSKSKAQAVADALNKLLSNLTIKCAKSASIRDYYYVGILGYGQSVGVAFTGRLAGKELVPISAIANYPARIDEKIKKMDDGIGGFISQKIKSPVWIDPLASGGTPMKQAFVKANKIIDNFISQYPYCFPPTIIHITDGASTDGDPRDEMKNLASQVSRDGNVLLFNLHISSNPNAQKVNFPRNNYNLPDQYSQMLFETSSHLTDFMISVARNEYNLNVTFGSKGFVLNGDLDLIVTALDIGTRPSNFR